MKTIRIMLLKQKRKLIYSALLFVLSAMLLIGLTLGWFQALYENKLSGIELYNSGVKFSLYRSADGNFDGVPDTDGNGDIVYIPQAPEQITFQNVYPQYSVKFKAVVSTGVKGGSLNVFFKSAVSSDISVSGGSAPDPLLDAAQAFRIQYTDPGTGQTVDKALAELKDANGIVNIVSGYRVAGNTDFTFLYTIYMDGSAGNGYKNKMLTLDKAVISFTQDS